MPLPIESRAHQPAAAIFGIPRKRQLNESIRRRPMQIGPDLVTGPDHVVHLLLHYVSGLAVEAGLIASLEIFPIPLDHREVTLGWRMKVSGLRCPFRQRVGGRRPAERASHAGFAVCFRDRRMARAAYRGVDVRRSSRLFATRATASCHNQRQQSGARYAKVHLLILPADLWQTAARLIASCHPAATASAGCAT